MKLWFWRQVFWFIKQGGAAFRLGWEAAAGMEESRSIITKPKLGGKIVL